MSSLSHARFSRVLSIVPLPVPVRKMLAYLSLIFSLRNVLLLFCLLNLKNLPLAWELRLIYRSWRVWRTKRDVARILDEASSLNTTPEAKASITSHPLFAPQTISTRSPLLEIDHNIHKSNSTYFSDLDESRTGLMVHLLSSTKMSPKELEGEGFKGSFAVILGSVHASFLREIKPYEAYQIRSRVLGWDEKWIIIASNFVRPRNATDRAREAKDWARKAKALGISVEDLQKDQPTAEHDEVLLASCLSKYVVKKGRYTVPPERCWRAAGWLPVKPAGHSSTPAITSTSLSPTPDIEHVDGEVKITEEDLRRKAQEMAAKTAEKLEQAQANHGTRDLSTSDVVCRDAASKWSWADLEAERARGMKLAENWLGLDKGLKDLWQQDSSRGIVS